MTFHSNKIDSDNYLNLHKLQEVIDYIEAHLLEVLTLDQIAEHFYCNSCLLNQIFKLVTQVNIIEYVRNRRISLAAKELRDTNHSIIDIALSHCYETPEAFTKAFQRIYGFPPSFVRRTNPELPLFEPMQIQIKTYGGWVEDLTKPHEIQQENVLSSQYNETIQTKGGLSMKDNCYCYQIQSKEMKYCSDYERLLALAKQLKAAGIRFKVDGKTMIFAHGIEFSLDKICLTFLDAEKSKVNDFFTKQSSQTGEWKTPYQGFDYMDTEFQGFLIRCMCYHQSQDSNSEQQLYLNTDLVDLDGEVIHVQSLEFYLENSKPDSNYYKLVTDYLNKRCE